MAAGSEATLIGLAIGLAIAAPVGPMGLLCIRRTLQNGRLQGLATGLGAATVHALYAAAALLGFSHLSDNRPGHPDWLGVAWAVVVCGLGLHVSRTRPGHAVRTATGRGSLITDYSGAVVLTLGNPITLVAVGTLVGAATGTGDRSAAALTGGVFAGSALWWLVLTTATDASRERLGSTALAAINRWCGILLLVFGGVAILRALGALM